MGSTLPGGISFDRVAGLYDATRGLPDGVAARVADLLARSIGAERTVELGVGTGRWARPLELRHVAIVGVDLSREMLGVARGKGLQDLVRGDVARLPFRDASFDGALASHVLHLVYDPSQVLRELARVIRGRMRTVLEYETERPDVVESYNERLESAGLRNRPPGLSERSLARELAPDLVRDAVTFHQRSPASMKIDPLERRAYRDTWATPEADHRRIIGELRQRYTGVEVLSETRIEIAEWDRVRLQAFAAQYRPGSSGDRA